MVPLVVLALAFHFAPASSQLGAKAGSRVTQPSDPPSPSVTLRSTSGATIGFHTNNGETVDDAPPQVRELPYLVLTHNGALTNAAERTLIVTVRDLVVPPPGITVTLTLETQHSNPDLGDVEDGRITVWRHREWLGNPTLLEQRGATIVFEHEFNATVLSGQKRVPTPTDYFRYELEIVQAGPFASEHLVTYSQDHAFLMENQWRAPLTAKETTSDGIGPESLLVFYCDMFPFRRDNKDTSTWLSRDQVSIYVETDLVPAMVEAFHTQTLVWGFPWHPEWRSYRTGRNASQLSVALSDGATWFHGKAPGQGNDAISINVSRGRAEYDTLTDGLISTFHHELFHKHQRNIYQYHGGNGALDGHEAAWKFFTEGTAVLASSVGQPDIQFKQTWGVRAYALNARGFIGRNRISQGDLNKSYEQMNAYHAAAYWRFLYERCGGLGTDGKEHPAAGMRIIRKALNVLYAGDVVDPSSSTDLVGMLPRIMDQALGGSSCPFQTYGGSLQAFARAIYALRLEGGRCTALGIPSECGLYDPHDVYAEPSRNTITYRTHEIDHRAARQSYSGRIPSSYGIDFVEVALDPTTQGQPLTVEFSVPPQGEAEFRVAIWKLKDADTSEASTERPIPITASEPLTRTASDGHLLHKIPAIDTGEANRLGLIITRVDNDEELDATGTYTIGLQPSHEP